MKAMIFMETGSTKFKRMHVNSDPTSTFYTIISLLAIVSSMDFWARKVLRLELGFWRIVLDG